MGKYGTALKRMEKLIQLSFMGFHFVDPLIIGTRFMWGGIEMSRKIMKNEWNFWSHRKLMEKKRMGRREWRKEKQREWIGTK